MKLQTYIRIEKLKIRAFHGVLDQERRTGGDFIVSLRIGYPWQQAMESDDVSDTLSYAELANIVRQEMAVSSKLLENVAQRICNAVIREYPETESVSIDIKKIAPPMSADCDGAGVRITIYN